MSRSATDAGSLLNSFLDTLGSETRLLQQLVALRTRPDDAAARNDMAPLFATMLPPLTTKQLPSVRTRAASPRASSLFKLISRLT
jgi:hypothetical protein